MLTFYSVLVCFLPIAMWLSIWFAFLSLMLLKQGLTVFHSTHSNKPVILIIINVIGQIHCWAQSPTQKVSQMFKSWSSSGCMYTPNSKRLSSEFLHCTLLHTQTTKHHGCNRFVHCCMTRPQCIVVHIASMADTQMLLVS